MLNSKDISVVVQGAIDKNLTKKCLNSIHKFLPNAEIILSTWEGSDLEGLEYDEVVLNIDPEAYSCTVDEQRKYNLNRYLVSTKSGIAKSNRKYILKIRSDIILSNCNFLKYFDKFTKRDSEHSIFNHKVLTSSLYTIEGELGTGSNKGKYHPTPFHISDWWHFGLREDIALLFSCDVIDNFKEFAQYFKTPKYELEELNHRTWKFPPEQYLGVELAKKKYKDLVFEDCLNFQQVDLNLSKQFIINNFITLDWKQSGILLEKNFGYCNKEICKKFWKIPPHVYYTMFNFERYKEMYYGNKSLINLLHNVFYIFYNSRRKR